MEDANRQDYIEMNNNDDTNRIEDENNDSDDDEEEEYKPYYIKLDKDTYERLKKNDPNITDLEVPLSEYNDGKAFFYSIDWKVDGDCISSNNQLKTLRISFRGRCLGRPWGQHYILGEEGDSLPTKHQLQDLFSCIHQNISINYINFQSIQIDDEFGAALIEGLGGHRGLRGLEIGSQTSKAKLGSDVCLALGKVLRHQHSKLKLLDLPWAGLDDYGLGTICDGLLDSSTLKRLRLYKNKQITLVGWRELSTVIRHPNCKLVELDVQYTELDDESASVLGTALCGSTVKELNLSGQRQSISRTRWHTLLNQLSQTSIRSLDLGNNQIDSSSLCTLANISSLKSLGLFSIDSMTPTGWQFFFNSLQRRAIQLVELTISFNNIGNVGVVALGSLLGSMNMIKKLYMSSIANNNIAQQSWVSFFNSLQDSNLNDLGWWYLGNNSIDDYGMHLLVRLVSSMGSLKDLDLSSNIRVTAAGWQALTGYLRSPNFVLEELDISQNNIDDDTLVAFTSALAHNHTLGSLNLFECTDENDILSITERGLSAVSNILCNKRSILDTYNSNHTLHILGAFHTLGGDLRGELKSCSELNRNKDKTEVARQKILQTHFSDSSKMQWFLDMELRVMPTAIEWIGRPIHNDWKGKNVSGVSLLYNLIRIVPDLFDSNAHKKPSGVRVV